jgi:putative ABC transport system ATP-binding protein
MTAPSHSGSPAPSSTPTNGGAAPVIVTRGLVRRYAVGDHGVRALDGVDLTVEAGEFIALVGPSGSGKTTLLSILGCLDRPDEGSYHLDGHPVSALNDADLARVRNTRLGFVFQAFNLLPGLRADENVALPLRYGGVPRGERLRRAQATLATVGLKDRVGHRPAELSGGQCQRVAIARALVSEPAVLLADEPTGNLDSASGLEILELFADLHGRGGTIVMVTHSPEVASMADRRIHLADGRIVDVT